MNYLNREGNFLERAHCMALLVHAYQVEGNDVHSLMVALRQLNTTEEAEEDVHEVCIQVSKYRICQYNVCTSVCSWWKRMLQSLNVVRLSIFYVWATFMQRKLCRGKYV